MNDLELLFRGVLAGLAISAPVGPVNVLCISRTLTKGRLAGFMSGLGAAAADTVYGAIAGFSISFVIQFLLREEFWLRLCGGSLLIVIGIVYYFKKPQSLREQSSSSAHSDFISAFLLNLTNPTTVLSFLAILAVLGMGHHRARWLTVLLIAGIFCGAMLWWLVLIAGTSRFREKFDDKAMLWMNRIAGLAIGAFGIVTLALSRWHVPQR
jgi:threonine/homoserine/homoserine lactone efflux protein